MKCRCGEDVEAEVVLAFKSGDSETVGAHLCASTSDPKLSVVALELEKFAKACMSTTRVSEGAAMAYPSLPKGACHWESDGKIYAPTAECEHVEREGK